MSALLGLALSFFCDGKVNVRLIKTAAEENWLLKCGAAGTKMR